MRQLQVVKPFLDRTMLTAFTIKRVILLWDAPFSYQPEQKKLFAIFIGRFRKEFALFTVLFERSVVTCYFCGKHHEFTGE